MKRPKTPIDLVRELRSLGALKVKVNSAGDIEAEFPLVGPSLQELVSNKGPEFDPDEFRKMALRSSGEED